MKRAIAVVTIAILLFSCKKQRTAKNLEGRAKVKKTIVAKNVICFESLTKNDPFHFYRFSLIDM